MLSIGTSPPRALALQYIPVSPVLTDLSPIFLHIPPKKSCIQETLNLLTKADSITIAMAIKNLIRGYLKKKINYLSPVTCLLSPVTCHLSSVTCHVSPVTCHLSHVITRTDTAADPPLCNTSTMHNYSCTKNTKKNQFILTNLKNHRKRKNSKTSKN